MVKDKIIFIDSDGTVMDSMTLKHNLCFGPAIIDTYHFEQYAFEILNEWNNMNLYSKLRGINRFDGHYLILKYINDNFINIDFLDEYKTYLDNAKSKSNEDLEEYLSVHPNSELVKVLNWSKLTNELIVKYQEKVKPFAFSPEVIRNLHKNFRVIIISSANKSAVMHEWGKYNLLDYVDEICTQEIGTKSYMIKIMLEKYQPSSAIMLGDAISDLKSAKENDIYFYPIVPKKEVESWQKFNNEYSLLFKDNSYNEEKLVKDFLESLEQN